MRRFGVFSTEGVKILGGSVRQGCRWAFETCGDGVDVGLELVEQRVDLDEFDRLTLHPLGGRRRSAARR